MSDFSLKMTGNSGLMVRDITTTYNVWNIDEKEYQKMQMPYQDQELPESTEITAKNN
jgi:hypothetical protein